MKITFLLSLCILYSYVSAKYKHNYGKGHGGGHGFYGYPVGRKWGYSTHIKHPVPKHYYGPGYWHGQGHRPGYVGNGYGSNAYGVNGYGGNTYGGNGYGSGQGFGYNQDNTHKYNPYGYGFERNLRRESDYSSPGYGYRPGNDLGYGFEQHRNHNYANHINRRSDGGPAGYGGYDGYSGLRNRHRSDGYEKSGFDSLAELDFLGMY